LVAARAFAVAEELDVVDPELEELVPELVCLSDVELLLELALDEEPDELVLGAVVLGGAGVDCVGAGVVFTVAAGAGAGLTGAGSGFGSAARLAAGETAAAIVIASMPRMARDARFCCFLGSTSSPFWSRRTKFYFRKMRQGRGLSPQAA
jgi:hypothetical protein